MFRLIIGAIDEITKTIHELQNDLDECLTYFKLLFSLPNFKILLLHFNYFLDNMLPKLLVCYGVTSWPIMTT